MATATAQVLIIGTGGTIAGRAEAATDHVGYKAGSVGVEALVAAVPALAGRPLVFEQLAQLDSKDMDFGTWARLVRRVQAAMDDASVAGVVVTHGTDTLEETAYLLHRTLHGDKPVVLTAAMRPATALSADGPQNLLDAVTLASAPDVRGVVLCFGGQVHAAEGLRKVHTYDLAAFASPDGGALARIENGTLRVLQPWRSPVGLGAPALPTEPSLWPRVEMVMNAAGADGAVVAALEALALKEGRRLGLVAVGTGNGTLSVPLAAALYDAMGRGVAVLRTSRCAGGPVLGETGLPHAGRLSPPQARVHLLLQLLA